MVVHPAPMVLDPDQPEGTSVLHTGYTEPQAVHTDSAADTHLAQSEEARLGKSVPVHPWDYDQTLLVLAEIAYHAHRDPQSMVGMYYEVVRGRARSE